MNQQKLSKYIQHFLGECGKVRFLNFATDRLLGPG